MQRLAWVWIWLSLGCTPELDSCNTDADCETGLQCVETLCVLRPDADRDGATLDQRVVDTGPVDATKAPDWQVDALPPDAKPIDSMLTDAAPADAMLADAAPADAMLADAAADVTPERFCDDADNDGDSHIDEGFNVGAPCTTGLGICATEGTLACADPGSTQCIVAAPIDPGEEVCGLPAAAVDEDCDGQIDEGLRALRWGEDVVVGSQSELEMMSRQIDVAVTSDYVVALANLNVAAGAPERQAVVFQRGREAAGSLASLSPFVGPVFQAQIERAGDDFVVAGISADNPRNVRVSVLMVEPGNRFSFRRVETGFAQPIGRLALVPSPAGRVILFVHLQGMQTVVRRDLTNQLGGMLEWSLATPNYTDNAQFAAAARDEHSYVLWSDTANEDAPVMVFRAFTRQVVDESTRELVAHGEPVMSLRNDSVVLGSWTQPGEGVRGVVYRAWPGNATRGFSGIRGTPDIAYAGDDYTFLAAPGNSGGSLRMVDSRLSRDRSMVVGGAIGRLHVAASDRGGALVWRDLAGRVFVRPVEIVCR